MLKATTNNRDNPDTRRANYLHNADTMAAYHKTTTDAQHTTTSQQPQRGGEHQLPVPLSTGTINVTDGRGGEHQPPVPPATNTPNDTPTELQQHREEMQQTFDEISHIKFDNIMHAATIQRAADTHAKRATCQLQRLKAEAARIKSSRHSNPKQGLKHLSKSIGDLPAKPLLFVKRDSDTSDGGKKGERTTNPQHIDAIVKRAWKRIYDGIAGNMEAGIATFFSQTSRFITHMIYMPEFKVPDIDGPMVYDSFRKISESAGAMDGWHPKELAYLSSGICGHIATMLKQIEEGATWPESTRHARVVSLEKVGAAIGEVMSYRPLTITSPLYRAWTTMRLRSIEEWTVAWSLPEMFAGVPKWEPSTHGTKPSPTSRN